MVIDYEFLDIYIDLRIGDGSLDGDSYTFISGMLCASTMIGVISHEEFGKLMSKLENAFKSQCRRKGIMS